MCGSVVEGVIHQMVHGIAPMYDIPLFQAKSIGGRPPGPVDRCLGAGETSGAVESQRNLHVDLEYVWKCRVRCKAARNCTKYVGAITLSRHRTPVNLLRNPDMLGGGVDEDVDYLFYRYTDCIK
jgi:hypothetical protein